MERRTFATLRSAEFGFFGVVVYTFMHTPLRCGRAPRAGVFVFVAFGLRPNRISCCVVSIVGGLFFLFSYKKFVRAWL